MESRELIKYIETGRSIRIKHPERIIQYAFGMFNFAFIYDIGLSIYCISMSTSPFIPGI